MITNNMPEKMYLTFFILGLLCNDSTGTDFSYLSSWFPFGGEEKAIKTVYPYSTATTLGYQNPAPVSPTSALCHGDSCYGDNSTTDKLFFCGSGETINSSLVCDLYIDCLDGSNESKCGVFEPWRPKITTLPKQKVELFCNDFDKRREENLVLECSFVGYPEPLIKWKKYEGHVPSKCQQTSVNGHGTLTCPYFKQSDQGAYSCVAENSEGSAESQPKSIAKCSNRMNCDGFRIKNDEIEHCIECYCSGKTTKCKNIASDLQVVEIPFPKTKVEVFAITDGEIVFIPTESNLAPDNHLRSTSQEITYCSLNKEDFKDMSFLKSYGRNINIPRHTEKYNFLPNAPDLIIQNPLELTGRKLIADDYADVTTLCTRCLIDTKLHN